MLRENYATWRCGTHEISLARPRIMGILNVTPDSFSDGGENLDHKTAIARGLAMLDEGADIIDVGGESTRPGHTPVSSKEEAERVVPVVRALVEAGAVVSIDTRHADVARMCVRLGTTSAASRTRRWWRWRPTPTAAASSCTGTRAAWART